MSDSCCLSERPCAQMKGVFSVQSGRGVQSELSVRSASPFWLRLLTAWREGFPFGSCSRQASRHSEKEVISLSLLSCLEDSVSVSDQQQTCRQYLSRPQMTLSPILREAYVKHVWPSHPSRWPEVKPWPARTSHLCAVHREGQPHTRWGAECPSSSRCFMVTCPVGFITVTVPWHNVVFMKHPEEIPLGSLPTSVS